MPHTNISSILIVGAGHSGGRTAQYLREFGFAGTIHMVGDEASPPYERPALSKEVLTAAKPLDTLDLMNAERLEALALTRHFASVMSIDTVRKTAQLSNGQTLGFGALVFANGGSPRRLGIPGEDLPGVLSLRTKDDAARLSGRLREGQHIAVIGGGFIGLEVAASARKLGCLVTLVEAGPQLMGRVVPAVVAERARSVHASQGVQLHCNVSPVRVRSQGQRLELTLSNGVTVLADTLLVGIGIVPGVTIAEVAGVAVARGILVDAHLRTNVTNVYAIGDVAEFPSPATGALVRQETWHNAETQARVVAQNLMGGHVALNAKPWFWSDQYDFQLQLSGEPAAGAVSVQREQEGGDLIVFYLNDSGKIAGVCGWGMTARIAKDLKIARTLVERETIASAQALADPTTRLKSLL
jgi:3-phenylpropionate/trans-cinnamate dioxygenase ferredoxin reductase component